MSNPRSPALILHHPSSHVVLDGTIPPRDPREQPVAEPVADDSVLRLHFDFTTGIDAPENTEYFRQLKGVEAIHGLMDRYGIPDILRWARFAAYARGYRGPDVVERR